MCVYDVSLAKTWWYGVDFVVLLMQDYVVCGVNDPLILCLFVKSIEGETLIRQIPEPRNLRNIGVFE